MAITPNHLCRSFLFVFLSYESLDCVIEKLVKEKTGRSRFRTCDEMTLLAADIHTLDIHVSDREGAWQKLKVLIKALDVLKHF